MSLDKAIAKVNENTQNCTDFYDLAEPHEVFEKKLDVDVTPQLEVVDFYRGGRILHSLGIQQQYDQYEFNLETSGYISEVGLIDLFKNFKQGHVCFVGPAGSGKTTLMKATARKFLQGKYLQGIIKMVQYIRCGRFKAHEKVTAAELIFDNTGLTREEIEQVIEFAKTNAKEVIFMLDSLDTLQYTVDGVYEIISLYEPAYPEVIIWNLLSGYLIPGCRVITSSREHSIRNYWGEIRPYNVIALAGLTMESIKEIIVGYEGNTEAQETMEYLKIKAPILMLLCTTPVMLIYTLIGLKIKSDFIPNTMTGIMILVMQSIVRSPHTRQDNIPEILAKLKELSYNGTVQGRVLFTEEDFHTVDLKPEEATDLAILAPGGTYKKLLQGIHLLYFQHQSIQEMLASFHILQMDLESFEKFVEDHLNTGHYILIQRIVCGLLLNHDVFELAETLLGDIPDLEKKRAALKVSLQIQLNHGSQQDLLELFTALNEAKDGMIDIVKSMSSISMNGHSLSISDAHVIGSVAFYCTSLEMDFTNCNLNPSLLQTLASALKGSKVQVGKLLLRHNINMGVKGLSSVGEILSNQSCVEELDLGYCNLSSDQLQAFKSSLENTEIRNLKLFGNTNMGVKGLSSVGEILSNQSCVAELDLNDCNLSSDQLQAFKSSLENTEVGELLLYCNKNMGVKGLSSVGEILSNQSCVEELDLGYCNLSSDQLQAFKSSLGNTEIRSLNLDEERNASQGDIGAVVNLLPNITEDLYLHEWKMKDEEILQNRLDQLGSKLKIWLSKGLMRSNMEIEEWPTYYSSVHTTSENETSNKESTEDIQIFVPGQNVVEVSDDNISTRSKPLSNKEEIEQLEKGIAEELAKPAQYKWKITPKKEKIELPDITINIPEGAIDEDRDLEIEIIRQTHDFPVGTMAIAPVISFKPSMVFKKPVSISIKTWYSAIDEHLAVTILCKKSSGTWVPLQNANLGEQNQIEFEVMHFCKYCPNIIRTDGTVMKCHVYNGVYMKKETGLITSVICKGWDCLNKIEAYLYKNEYVNAVDLPMEHNLRRPLILSARIKISVPRGVYVGSYPPGHYLIVNRTFMENDVNYLYFFVDHLIVDPEKYVGWLKGSYIFMRDNQDDTPVPLEVKWPIQITTT